MNGRPVEVATTIIHTVVVGTVLDPDTHVNSILRETSLILSSNGHWEAYGFLKTKKVLRTEIQNFNTM